MKLATPISITKFCILTKPAWLMESPIKLQFFSWSMKTTFGNNTLSRCWKQWIISVYCVCILYLYIVWTLCCVCALDPTPLHLYVSLLLGLAGALSQWKILFKYGGVPFQCPHLGMLWMGQNSGSRNTTSNSYIQGKPAPTCLKILHAIAVRAIFCIGCIHLFEQN